MRAPRVLLFLSMLGAGIAAVTSMGGILGPGTYERETPAWAIQAVGQDYANLLVAVILIWSAARSRRHSVGGLYVWLGCLLYFIYAFAIYAFAVHFNRFFLAYIGVLSISFYAFVGTLASLDVQEVSAPLRDHPHRKSAGNLLIGIGAIFGVLWLSEIVPHILSNTAPSTLLETALWTNPVHVLDLAFLLPAMILVGMLLRRQNAWGLFLAVPLLVFAGTMGVGILTLFALSAARGLPVALPAAVVVGLVVLLSLLHIVLLLRGHVAGAQLAADTAS